MITVEHVTKTYGAFTHVDAGIQMFTERLGQEIFGAHVLAGDLAKGRRLGDQPRRCRSGNRPVGSGSTVRGRVMTAPDPPYVFRVRGHLDDHGPAGPATWPPGRSGITNLTGPIPDQPTATAS